MVNAPYTSPTPDLAAEVRRVAMRFGTNTVFENVSFNVRRGEVFVILGGSG